MQAPNRGTLKETESAVTGLTDYLCHFGDTCPLCGSTRVVRKAQNDIYFWNCHWLQVEPRRALRHGQAKDQDPPPEVVPGHS